MQPVIRKMKIEDAKVMAQIEKECFEDPWSEQMLAEEFYLTNAIYSVVEIDSKVIAYAGIRIILDEAHLTNVATLEQYRSKGIGNSLMQELIKNAKAKGAKSMTLEVRVSNEKAIRLYEKNGFEIAGRRKKNYQNREDAFIMWNYSL